MQGKTIFRGRKFFTKGRTNFIVLLLLATLFIYATFPRKRLSVQDYSQTVTGKAPPIVIQILGGLGNQFFQYAAALSIAKKRNSDIYLCVNANDVRLKALTTTSYSSVQRQYSLDQFNVPQNKLLSFYPSTKFHWNDFDTDQCVIDYYLDNRKVDHFIAKEVNVLNDELPVDKVLLIKDMFESDVFFAVDKQDILDTFQPTFDTRPIEHLIELVRSTENSVSVHFRRGDMARKDDFRLISISYQREAMQLIKQKLDTNRVTFFVFTDDLDYVKKHLEEEDSEPNTIVYMTEHTEDNTLYDFLLMSKCQHNIIPNSSFSWWAAYLNTNPNKIVIAPMPKYRSEWIDEHYTNSNHTKMMLGELAYPKGWLTIKPTFSNYSEVKGSI